MHVLLFVFHISRLKREALPRSPEAAPSPYGAYANTGRFRLDHDLKTTPWIDRDLCRFGQDTYTGQYKKYNCTDTLFINDEGDFLFWHRLQEASPEEMKAFISENNILFSIAFGPILVENGELQVCDWYPAGEIDKGYSRAGIGLKDHLHYFYMSLNHSAEQAARWTVNQFGERMYQRGLQQAYCLDGGQTSEIVWRGSPYNYIDFGGEREVSDIIYFATAIPESEGTP